MKQRSNAIIMPQLSIIIPNYNYAKTLERAVSSVAESTFPSFEIILIDDGSTDNSWEIATELKEKYPSLRLYRQEQNQGLFKTVEWGVELTKGEYIHFLASDDYRLPGFIEKSMKALQQFPSAPMVCSDFGFLQEGKLTQKRSLPFVKTATYFNSRKTGRVLALTNFWIPSSTAILKKEAYSAYGGLNRELGILSDWVLFHWIALEHGVVYLPDLLSVSEIHPQSYSVRESRENAKNVYLNLLTYLESHTEIRRLFLGAQLSRKMVRVLKKEIFTTPKYWGYLSRAWVRFPIWAINKLFKRRPVLKMLEK